MSPRERAERLLWRWEGVVMAWTFTAFVTACVAVWMVAAAVTR